ncbi:MAG: SOS response-associated peptidase [Candidatus Dormibacteria bacterium]
MCGRFGQSASGDHLREYFAGLQIPDPEPRYNVAPTQKVLAVTGNPRRGWSAGMVRWGLLPYFSRTIEEATRRSVINARQESALQKPMFARAARNGRVVVPATLYWEWMKPSGSGAKQPMLLRRKDHDLMLFAALVDTWRSDDGTNSLSSLAILTTGPSADLAHVHNRMPVILDDGSLATWLDPMVSPLDAWARIGHPPAGEIVARPAGNLVNSVRNEGVELLEAPAGVLV